MSAVGRGSLDGAPGINHETLSEKGFTPDKIETVEKAVSSAFDIKFVFNKWTLGEEFCTEVLGLAAERLDEIGCDLLAEIGFSKADIEAANEYACGSMSLKVRRVWIPHTCPFSIAQVPAAVKAHASSRSKAIFA